MVVLKGIGAVVTVISVLTTMFVLWVMFIALCVRVAGWLGLL